MKIDKRKDRPRKGSEPITIERLFTLSDVNEVVAKINSAKSEITGLICISTARDGAFNSYISDNLDLTHAVYLLERVKHMLLTGMNEGEQDGAKENT